MIKPVKIINGITDIASKAASKTADTTAQIQQETPSLAQAGSELLQTYHGVKIKKLFASFPEFLENFKAKLESYKDFVPENLLQKISKATDNNDFSLRKIISQHYDGLNNCHTLEQVKKLFPEIEVPNLKFEEEIAEQIRGIVPKSLCDEIAKLSTKEEKQKVVTDFFNKSISKQVEKWEIYPEFQKIQQSVTDEIITGKYIGKDFEAGNIKAFNSKMPIRYRLMFTPDREEAYISMLRQHFISGKPITDISLKISEDKILTGYALRRHGHFPELDKNFRKFIEGAEDNAKQFSELSTLDTHQINSAIMTETWTKSRLRADIGNETKFGKDWSIVRAVWQKTMFPETTFYPTDKLIDAYLLNLFKSGKRQADIANPLTKYTTNPQMDKNKIMLLKRLYSRIKELDSDKRILQSPAFTEFKAQFDIEGMSKTIEDIETHYKNAFFKRFWTDERKLRFTTALNQNREIAGQNIELSEKILTDAMNSVFTEI